MTDESSLLAVAGLPEETESVYLFVMHRGRTRAVDVVERFDIDPARAAAHLEELRDLGLVARAFDTAEDAYAAVDPRYALTAIADRLSGQVRRIRDEIPTLADQFERSAAEDAGTAQTRVVRDAADVASWYVRLQHQAKDEVLTFDRPPYVSSSLEPLETVLIGRGVTWRAIYTPESFSREGAWEETLRLTEQGEQARIVPALPLKLVIADRSIALLSLSLDGIRTDALVTESPPLIALLHGVFEAAWARALPLTSTLPPPVGPPIDLPRDPAAASPAPGRASAPPTREQQAILALIGAGLTDDAIAARLGISVRSLRRRSQRLMADLGAANRFQLGVEAARRGWV
jgi:DNA-binding CsgD family transcriptional regulator/sugar-specific transcriptional regulator TrmB